MSYFTVKAANAYGSDTKAFSLVIDAIAPEIVYETLDNAPENTSYSHTFRASGTSPITWTVTEGSSLPQGLTLNSNTGVISGTPK